MGKWAAACLSLLVTIPGVAAESDARALIVTSEQLRALSTAVGGGPVGAGIKPAVTSRGSLADSGPRITMVKPAQGGPVAPPLEVELAFQPRRAAVDLASLRVWYVLKKGSLEFEIDVTEQARKHFTLQGAKLWVPDSAPRGTHVIRLLVKDEEGQPTEGRFSLEVL